MTEEERVMKYLEDTKIGANMSGDVEMVTRLDRAMVAFCADLKEEIFIQDVVEDFLNF